MKTIEHPLDALGLAESLAIIVGGIVAAMSAFSGWSPVIIWGCAIGALVGSVFFIMRLHGRLKQRDEKIKALSKELDHFKEAEKYDRERQEVVCETVAKLQNILGGQPAIRRTPEQTAEDGIRDVVKYTAFEVRALDGHRHEINLCSHQLCLDDSGLPTEFTMLVRCYQDLAPRGNRVQRLDDYSSFVWLREDCTRMEFHADDTRKLGSSYKTPSYDREERRSLNIWKCAGMGPVGPNWNGILCASSPDPNVFTAHHRRIFEIAAHQIYTILSACALLNEIPPDPTPHNDDHSQDKDKGSAGATA